MSKAQELRRRRLQFRRLQRRRSVDATMTITEHLSELRTRLVIAIAAFVVFSIGAFAAFPFILDFLMRPYCQLPSSLIGTQGCHLNVFGVVEPFMVRLKVTAMVGLVASSPVWLYQLWAFVMPALTKSERRYAFPFVATSMTLFLIGAAFAYLTLPFGLRFLIGIGGPRLLPLLRADSYLNFIGLMVLAFGITFELPLVLFFLGLLGVIKVEQLRKQRKLAVVLIFALAAVVTPSQDPYTMSVMAIPLYLLYEITIVLLSVVRRRRSAGEDRHPAS
jgi:sec-independent protein translocase protein TatC